MNTPTLVSSLIFAAVVAVIVSYLIHLMLRGWRRRAERQVSLVGTLPALPETVGPAEIPATKGLYVGSTLAPQWNDRIAVGDLGYRSKAVLTRYPETAQRELEELNPSDAAAAPAPDRSPIHPGDGADRYG